jgi:DNA polymerase-4
MFMNRHNNRILHVDGDSFFASCEIALDSSLEGRPVWVGGGRRGDGIVIAANRIAKKYGIKTGTACFEAKRLCPSGVLCKREMIAKLWGADAKSKQGVLF